MRQILRPAFLPDNGVKAQVKITCSRPAARCSMNRLVREAGRPVRAWVGRTEAVTTFARQMLNAAASPEHESASETAAVGQLGSRDYDGLAWLLGRLSKSTAPGRPSDECNRAGVTWRLRASEGPGCDRLHAIASTTFARTSARPKAILRRCCGASSSSLMSHLSVLCETAGGGAERHVGT